MQVYKGRRKKQAFGMVAIDSCGHLLHAFGTPIQFVGKAIPAEAQAIREAVERALQKKTIYEDVWRLMKSFEEIEIIYIPRTWNVLSHNLAKIYISCINRFSWDSAFPSCVVTYSMMSYGHLKHVLK
ncbi:hypothetical protein R3W88_019635 [Solanum pinnatisectum]|uniref:RNase H type-1 domain-containing protein n=1 Tax=Solanum pinnatisectum TaxID=50273 RepID=A0AAV9KLF1_9SOLN|nr:hypothetical protein R3W88_019635 [Solanum pinnatisectum]